MFYGSRFIQCTLCFKSYRAVLRLLMFMAHFSFYGKYIIVSHNNLRVINLNLLGSIFQLAYKRANVRQQQIENYACVTPCLVLLLIVLRSHI